MSEKTTILLPDKKNVIFIGFLFLLVIILSVYNREYKTELICLLMLFFSAGFWKKIEYGNGLIVISSIFGRRKIAFSEVEKYICFHGLVLKSGKLIGLPMQTYKPFNLRDLTKFDRFLRQNFKFEFPKR